MKSIITTGLLIIIVTIFSYSQNWEVFLEKHIDNLTNADTIPGLANQYSDEVIQQKKNEMFSLIYNHGKSFFSSPDGYNDPSIYPTHIVYAVSAMSPMNTVFTLGTDEEKQNARNLMYNAMLYYGNDGEGQGVDFTSFYIAGYFLNLKPEVFTPDKELDIRDFYAENSGGIWGSRFWNYNTENHCQMTRATTYGVGLRWPTHNFIVRSDGSRENGIYMYTQIEENHIKNYIGYLYKYGMGENLSPSYMGTHLRPWTVFYELADKYNREPAKGISGAILEYYYALVGLNSQHNMYIGTINRAIGSLSENWRTHPVAKIFGGYSAFEPLEEDAGSLIAESNYIPHIKTRALIAGDVRKPYSLMQTCAINGWYQEQVQIDDKGSPPLTFDENYAKTIFRYVYTDRSYSIGSGNIKCLLLDELGYENGIAGSAAWEYGFLVFGSPKRHLTENWGDKFFEDHKAGYIGNVGSDSWAGYSPYMEMAQFENTVLVYCIIPDSELYKIAQIHLSTPMLHGGEELVTDETNRTWYAKYLGKEDSVYVGIIPLHYSPDNHQPSGFIKMERIMDDGAGDNGHCGYVVEMAQSSECTFEEFKSRVKASRISWDKTNARLTYTNRKGHTITLQHSSHTSRIDKLPAIEITPYAEEKVIVNWEEYPPVRSPYMRIITEDNRAKMVINDNLGGIKVDYDGTNVKYLECNDYVPENIINLAFPDSMTFKVNFSFIEEKTRRIIENAGIYLNGMEYITDVEGKIELTGMEYGIYGVVFNNPGYVIFEKFGLEISSDTSFVFQIRDLPHTVCFHVVNAATFEPIYRAVVYFNDKMYLTNSTGMVDLGELTSDEIVFDISHPSFFNYSDSLILENDTIVLLKLTNKLANVFFKITNKDRPIDKMKVKFSEFEALTNSSGMAYFYQYPARIKYDYTISGLDFPVVTDSVFIEFDTTIHIDLNASTSSFNQNKYLFSINPNPVNDFIIIGLNVSNYQSFEVIIYDLLGKPLIETFLDGPNTLIDVSHLNNGMYLLKLQGTDKSVAKRFIIDR